MENNRISNVLGVLRDCYKPHEHGWMWLLAQPPGEEHGVMQEVTGERPDNESVARLVVDMAPRIAPVEMFIAICRRDGRPTERDRELWRTIRDQLDDIPDVWLLDLVIFCRDSVWSMREEDAQSNAVA